MVHCKNASGAPSDGDESPPRRTEVARGKRVKRGGRSSGIRIGERRFHLEGRQLGTKATEDTEDAPVEQPIEDPEEIEEQTVHSPQRRRSGRTRAQVTPRPEGQRHGGRPPPRA
jgi:hypothetical protein